MLAVDIILPVAGVGLEPTSLAYEANRMPLPCTPQLDRRESNPHAFERYVLNVVCLPFHHDPFGRQDSNLHTMKDTGF